MSYISLMAAKIRKVFGLRKSFDIFCEVQLFIEDNNIQIQYIMNKQIKLNEEEFQALIEESVKRVLNEGVNEENMDEGLWNNIKALGSAAAHKIADGGNIRAHYNGALANYAKKDVENLKNKYGVADGQNRNQYVKSNTQQQVAQIQQKYQAKIQQLNQQMEAEIAKVKQQAGERFQSYKTKKDAASKEHNTAKRAFDKQKNASPYAYLEK